MAGGDWLLVQELLERGDPEFVDQLRRIDDSELLAGFAARWYTSASLRARELLLVYLEGPLNAYRHEPLVKRLFKLAEQAGDDAVMARFLVALDRSVRRVQRERTHWENQEVGTETEAQQIAAAWTAQGYSPVLVWPAGRKGRFLVNGSWSEPVLTVPVGTAMPRGKTVIYRVDWDNKKIPAPDWVQGLRLDPRKFRDEALIPDPLRPRLERFRLFSVATRRYLRRRAWRYFRRLGNSDPARYVAAIAQALILYEDADVADGLAMLDNWGLMHALFHHSEVLESRPRGWLPREGRSLAELEPAPAFALLWKREIPTLFDLARQAQCRPVRRWAMAMLDRDRPVACAQGLEAILALLDHDDPEVVAWAGELLSHAGDLTGLGPARWLEIARTAGPEAMEPLGSLMRKYVDPERITLAEVLELARSRSLPLARLGLDWLRTRSIAAEDRTTLMPLLEAHCQPLRPELLAWLRSVITADRYGHEEILAFLDSRHADARAEGLAWFLSAPAARDDVELWQRLLESPHDDVRLALSRELERVVHRAGTAALNLEGSLDAERLRGLWASVLLNVHRGGRAKPGVIGQVARRLERNPAEAPRLLPLLGIAMRSLRRPERHAALAAVVRLIESKPAAAAAARAAFPELKWE